MPNQRAKLAANLISNILQELSVGQHETGLYYKRKRYVSSVIGGILTILALLFLIIIGAQLISDVQEKKEIKTITSLKTKYEYWYNMTCENKQNFLEIAFNLSRNIDEYFQYVTADDLVTVQVVTFDKKFNTDNYFVLFQSDSSFFNGNKVQRIQFMSLPLKFRNQHIINMGIMIIKSTESLWQLETQFEITQMYLTMRDPTYNFEQFKDNTLQMVFSFNKFFQNYPIQTIYLEPASYFSAISKLGGYFSVLSILGILLMNYHQWRFERELFYKMRQISIKEDQKDVTRKQVEESLSFDKLFELSQVKTLKQTEENRREESPFKQERLQNQDDFPDHYRQHRHPQHIHSAASFSLNNSTIKNKNNSRNKDRISSARQSKDELEMQQKLLKVNIDF
ncbi:UNKNOWN [Stylonychia lemnae]|uniref:Transmembrane protein n=1 Tax=Stylonychia lemnae TaxID=5949 RepID=A0A078AYX9_STYLE|nr:UNKNOWN [Stylonychia lemnae]|eukprot:CDW86387.1 UNKNOWN [Stylonychia lemnae]